MHLQQTIAVFLLLLAPSFGQGPDSRGTEFFLAFIENPPFQSEPATDMELFIVTTSNTPAQVTVTTPLFDSSFSETLTVSRGTAQKVAIPTGIRGIGTELAGKGIWVQSTEEISVFAVNKESKSTDAYIALPSDVLGTEYYAMTYIKQAGLAITATQDNTEVNITWPAGTQGVDFGGTTYGPGDTLTLTLDKFEVFHALDSAGTSDLTGAHIVSDKPISVVSGNKKIKVPTTNTKNSADHLTEMMLPVSTWGKEFITSSTPGRTGGDLYRFLASEDNTTVTLSGGSTFNLNAGEFAELDIATDDYQQVTSDKPIAVAMFAKTLNGDGPTGGDPAMTLIPPVLQYAADNTWSTIQTPDGSDFSNRIAVVIETSEISGLRLEGDPITWDSQTAVPGTTKTHLSLDVTPGSHNIYHTDPTVTFMAAASGTTSANSYAYLAGLRAAEINTVCVNTTTVPGDVVDNDCDERIDEETDNGVDDDGDGLIDEDLAMPPRVDGEWGAWSTPGPCSVECGEGYQVRTRECDNPAPANGGVSCVGNSQDLVACIGTNCVGSGTPCNRDKQVCLNEATCNTVTDKCSCPAGTSGDGFLECVPTGQRLCYAEGDPHVHTWGGSVASVNLPCWYRLSKFEVPITTPTGLEYDTCSIDVQGLNELTADGLYFVSTLKVEVDFVKHDFNGNSVSMGTVTTFEIARADVEGAAAGTNPWPQAGTVVNDVTMIPSYDDDDNIALLEVDQCNFKAQFRPYVTTETIPMTFRPGLTLSVASNSDLSVVNDTICTTFSDGSNGFQNRASSLNLGSGVQVVIHDILDATDIDQTQGNPSYNTQCDSASSTFSTSCDTTERPLALQMCSQILNSLGSLLSCLTVAGVDPVVVFDDCLTWVCTAATTSCNTYRSSITGNGCTTTALMDEVGCDVPTLNAKIAEFNA